MISRIKRMLHLSGTEVPVVRLSGIIASREQSLNLDRVAPILDRGFALAKKRRQSWFLRSKARVVLPCNRT